MASKARVQLWLCPSASPLRPSPLHTQAPRGPQPGDDALGEAVGGDGEGNLLLQSPLLEEAWEVMGPDVRGFPCQGGSGAQSDGGQGVPLPAPPSA